MAIGLATFGPVPASAQTDQAGAAKDNIEEVVVVARRREERLQVVPMSITAFTATTLQNAQIQNYEDLQRAVPSFTFNPSQRSGIGTDPTIRGLPGVVTYFSEVPLILGNQVGDYQALDNTVEIDKGPQGTLFGQNTTGGAVQLRPNHPTNNYEGSVQALFGSYNWQRYELVANVPIVQDRLLVRFAGAHDQRDGFTTVADTPYAGRFEGLDLDNRDSWYGRIGITVRPTDSIENYLVMDTTYVHTNGTALILDEINPNKGLASNVINFPLNNPPFAVASPFYFLSLQKQLGIRHIIGFDPAISLGGRRVTYDYPGPIEKAQNYDIVDITTWDIGDDFSLKNILGYVNGRQLTRQNFTDTPIVAASFSTPRGWNNATVGSGFGSGLVTQYTEELQAHGKLLEGALNYTLGGYLLYSTGGPEAGQVTSSSAALPSQLLVYTGGGQTSRTQALYGQADYDLGSLWDALAGLQFTAGYRYNWDWATAYEHQGVADIALVPGLTPCVAGVGPNCGYLSNSGHFHSPGWNLSLKYQPDADTMFYVRSSKAYRPGGFTPAAPIAADQAYQPETLVDVEIGAKATMDLFGMKAVANVDAYQGWYTDIQELVIGFVTINGAKNNFGLTENAASATIEGFEWEGALYPTQRLELRTSGSYNHDYFTSFTSATYGQLAGLSFPGFPHLKLTAGATYHLPVDEAWGDIAARVDWYYQTHYLDSTDNGPGTTSTHHLINLGIDWTNVFQQPFDLDFFMTNVTDTEFVTAAFPLYNQEGFVSKVWNEPRMWGIKLRYRFEPASASEAAPAAYTPPPVQAPAPAAVAQSHMVFFDFDKSDLTPQAVSIVDQAAANAGPAHVTRITVTGHTDTVGSDAYNMRLSRRRAESVAAELEKKGIASSEIEIVAKGKRDLLVPTGDGVREPQNRRVQIVYAGGATS